MFGLFLLTYDISFESNIFVFRVKRKKQIVITGTYLFVRQGEVIRYFFRFFLKGINDFF